MKKGTFAARLWRNDITGELLVTVGVACALTALTYLFAHIELTNDRMVPFKSTGFVLGSGAIFYMAFAYGTRQALYLSVGVLMLVLMVWLDVGDMSSTSIAVQLPLIGAFFLGLSVLPNALPTQYEEDIENLAAKNRELEKVLVRLREQYHRIQEKDIIEKQADNKKEQVKIGSRTAFLNAFARELLQASSNRELLNLLFHNATRLLALEECVMMIVAADTPEAVIARALHAKHEQLENSRVPLDNALLAQVVQTKQPLSLNPPAQLVPDVTPRFLLPIVSDGAVIAVYAMGQPKGAEMGPDDEEFLAVLAVMLAGAMEQLRISSSTA